jgi:DNA-binding NarL/FixJ family response regulator
VKSETFSFVVVADQVGSRSADDRVPLALGALSGLPLALPFERTAGDEIQGLAEDPASVVAAVVGLTRLEDWRIGIGAGSVDGPLPSSTRAARGTAYLAARAAISEARHAPTALALRLGTGVGGGRYGELDEVARDAESALWLLRSVLGRRSREGWELMDLLDQGLTNAQAAAELGISPSAVSQRLNRAARQEQLRGTELSERLLARLRSLAVDTREPA